MGQELKVMLRNVNARAESKPNAKGIVNNRTNVKMVDLKTT
jgi:hypothetical protein